MPGSLSVHQILIFSLSSYTPHIILHSLIHVLSPGSAQAHLHLHSSQTSMDNIDISQALFYSWLLFPPSSERQRDPVYLASLTWPVGRTSVHKKGWDINKLESWLAGAGIKQVIVRQKPPSTVSRGHRASCLQLVWGGLPKWITLKVWNWLHSAGKHNTCL